jgi:KUP system potassium uptake protein
VPGSLGLCRKHGLIERNVDLEHASYFVSRITITPAASAPQRSGRKRLFIAMARNAASPVEHFGLPGERTVTVGSEVAL